MKAVLSLLVFVTACVGDDIVPPEPPPAQPPPSGGGGGGGGGGSGSGGSPQEPWILFATPKPVGVGLAWELGYKGSSGLTFDTSDPAIATIAPVPGKPSLRVTGTGPGTVDVRAFAAGAQIDQVTIDIVRVDHLGVQFRNAPSVATPVPQLAALANSSDALAVVFQAANGDVLAGTAPITTSGAVSFATLQIEDRLSDLLGAPRSKLAFGPSGAGALVANLDRELQVPIEIVPAATSYELATMMLDWGVGLVPLPAEIEKDTYYGIDIIGRTADGRYVAGVQAAWAVDQSVASGPLSEVAKVATTVGTFVYRATVGTTTLSHTVVVVP